MSHTDLSASYRPHDASETPAQRERRQRLLAEYEERRRRDEEAIAAIWGRSMDSQADARYVREQRRKA